MVAAVRINSTYESLCNSNNEMGPMSGGNGTGPLGRERWGSSKTPSPIVESSGCGLGSWGEWGRARWVRKDWAEGCRGMVGDAMVVLLSSGK